MRLVTFRADAAAGALGVVASDRVLPVAMLGAGLPSTMTELLAGWPATLEPVRTAVEGVLSSGDIGSRSFALAEVELLPPVPRPGKIACAGINYRQHASEQNREPPDHPVMFAKFASALVSHGAEVRWSPGLTQAVDFEAELAVVIGAACRRVAAVDALGYVAGYTCLNDVSARDLQYADRQFVRAKSLDTFGPMGPWLVTADEIPDPQTLAIRCLVNGNVMQDSNTADMIFSVAELVAFCSQAFTLEPGDVIATGTPGGVGWFRTPKQMLHDGDEVVVEIEGVGRLVNRCREEPA